MARIRKTPPERFGDAINDILEDFVEGEVNVTKSVLRKVSKDGVKLLKDYSRANFDRHSRRRTYYTQWTDTVVNETQTGLDIVLYSRKYQLPHLLEYSHTVGKRLSGHYDGRPHIVNAEKDIEHALMKLLEGKL